MPSSSFVDHHTKDLIRLTSSNSLPEQDTPDDTPTLRKEQLRYALRGLSKSISPEALQETTTSLLQLEPSATDLVLSGKDAEERSLERAVVGKLAVALYADALDTFLDEASQTEAEAEWWAEMERSGTSIAMYFLSTLPIRLYRVNQTILQTIQARNIPFSASVFTPSSLRQLFPSSNSLRPNTLLLAMFPHLRLKSHIISLNVSDPPQTGALNGTITSTRGVGRALIGYITLPLELTYQECRFKRKELEKIRDERAETLGSLAEMRDALARALDPPIAGTPDDNMEKLGQFVHQIHASAGGAPVENEMSVVGTLRLCSIDTLQKHGETHSNYLSANELSRPSRLTRLWPRLLILPPLTLLAVRYLYESRASLAELAKDTVETVETFFQNWLLEPLKDVVKTVRAGGDEGVIVHKEGVAAEFDSLERMTLDLARDKLKYTSQQLDELSSKIRLGDLTPVLKIYEADIKTPLKSAVSGTLLRSVFIQVQKAKVDIDQALSGIDRLLKSQELTFAFVGVAPAFAIVYLAGGYLGRLWSGGRGRGRFGGKRNRAGVWAAMRRIERLLIAQPKSSTSRHQTSSTSSTTLNGAIPALTSGLLLLSVTRLRTYAEAHLPVRSRLREGFLEDVEDLEDPSLGRAEKMRVVDRMWKSYGRVLGWDLIAGEGSR